MPLLSPYLLHGAAGGSYTEQAVTVPSGAYLTSNAALGTGTYKSLLFFGSLIGTGEAATRRILLSMLGQDSAIYASYTASLGLFGIRTDIEVTSGGGAIHEVETVDESERYHVLWETWVTGTNLRSVGYLYDTSVGSWVQAFNQTDANASAFLNLGSTPFRVFCRQDTIAHQFLGTSFRQALWCSTTGAAIADIATNASERDAFVDGSSIADPATTRTAHSAADRIFDFVGDAANYNITAGTGGGDAGFTYTATGTFTG